MSYPRGYYNPSYTQSLYPSVHHHHHPYQQESPYAMERKSRPLFEAMEKLTLTCNGLAHTLESTLMATHSGFNALLQLTHQFRTIRHSVGHVFGVLSLLRWLKSKILGSRVKSSTLAKFSIKEFESYSHKSNSITPWMIVLVVSIGVPMIMQLHQKQVADVEQKNTLSTGTTVKAEAAAALTASKPTKLDFARALYSFQAESSNELTLRPNDLIAILSKEDADWWQGRLKNGKIGYFPANHVEIIEKNIEIPTRASIAPSA
ncbi:Rad2 nuclease [Mucor velutinosus]|uniref:Rad2 nuclease n=1 Tax=Mucor velutinosus TaxID=708070 RepID=A0AAN7DLA4_9FUNG|nr:Rad2 nuclease [Mucor velutinosus]